MHKITVLIIYLFVEELQTTKELWARIEYPWYWFAPIRWLTDFDQRLDYHCEKNMQKIHQRSVMLSFHFGNNNEQNLCFIKKRSNVTFFNPYEFIGDCVNVIVAKKKEWESFDNKPPMEDLAANDKKQLNFLDLLFIVHDQQD
uniref:Bestrophin homolog n=1 Tax=Elaeophora elaphi TaxID=1147741 RepID=A0A0R3RNN9_9BILA